MFWVMESCGESIDIYFRYLVSNITKSFSVPKVFKYKIMTENNVSWVFSSTKVAGQFTMRFSLKFLIRN
jgi:hypothetical protein